MKSNLASPSYSGLKFKYIPPFHFVTEFEVYISFSNSILEEMGDMPLELSCMMKYVSCSI